MLYFRILLLKTESHQRAMCFLCVVFCLLFLMALYISFPPKKGRLCLHLSIITILHRYDIAMMITANIIQFKQNLIICFILELEINKFLTCSCVKGNNGGYEKIDKPTDYSIAENFVVRELEGVLLVPL